MELHNINPTTCGNIATCNSLTHLFHYPILYICLFSAGKIDKIDIKKTIHKIILTNLFEVNRVKSDPVIDRLSLVFHELTF